MIKKDKVFVSYCHDKDQCYRNEFERICIGQLDIMISDSLQKDYMLSSYSPEKKIQIIRDKYLRDSIVTIVLIGNETWKRKDIDLEIFSSLNDIIYNSRSGLIGIILPSFKKNIPKRLLVNINNGFAKLYNWSNNPKEIQNWINEAVQRSEVITPYNSFEI